MISGTERGQTATLMLRIKPRVADRSGCANLRIVLALMSALSFASALTAITAFRFQMKPSMIVAYFTGLAVLEGVAHVFFLPEGAIPIEATFVLLGITGLFIVTNLVLRRFAPE